MLCFQPLYDLVVHSRPVDIEHRCGRTTPLAFTRRAKPATLSSFFLTATSVACSCLLALQIALRRSLGRALLSANTQSQVAAYRHSVYRLLLSLP